MSRSILVKTAFITALMLCLSTFVSGPIALVGGFVFYNLFGHPFIHYNQKATNWLLKIAVVGLGFGMNIEETLMAGRDGLVLTIISIFFILTIGFLMGKFLKLQKEITHLISCGTAICGGSAIAALAPIIKASEKDVSISLGTVFLLNSVALLIFPPIGHFLNLTEHQFGLWSAIAIHDTSSVVGAANAYGNEALKVATSVKLARALWIIPLSIISVFLFKGKNDSIKIPWFIFLFIGVILLNSIFTLPTLITNSITSASKSILVLTLFLIGAGLSIDKIKVAGWKPLILAGSLWIMLSVISLLIITYV